MIWTQLLAASQSDEDEGGEDEVVAKHLTPSSRVSVHKTPAAMHVPTSTSSFSEMLFGEPYSLLSYAKFDAYSEQLVELGYDSAVHLLEMTEEEIEDCAAQAKMKPGHVVRFKKLLSEARGHLRQPETSQSVHLGHVRLLCLHIPSCKQ